MHRIIMHECEWARLRLHLLQNDVEQAAIGFADFSLSEDPSIFTVQRLDLLSPDDFDIQSAHRLELTDDAQARIIKTAWDTNTVIVEFHSHIGLGHKPRFSPTDVWGFDEFVPHVRWRLGGRPYVAIVIAREGFDSLAWISDHPKSAAIEIDGNMLFPTGNTLRALNESHHV